jgi:hypothetical protein
MGLFGFAGFRGLGSAAEDAVWQFTLALRQLIRSITRVGDLVNTDPVAAIRAEADAKAQLAKAEAAYKTAMMGRVFIPPAMVDSLRTARRGVEELGPIVAAAQENVMNMRQVDPEWTSPRYSRADFPPAPTDYFEDEPPWTGNRNLMGLGRYRRRRRRR